MVGAGGQVFVHPADHRSLVAPHVVGVVRHRQIPSDPIGSDGTGLGFVGREDDGLFWEEKWPVAQQLTGPTRVVGRDEVGVRAAGPIRGELQHLGPQRREHPGVDRDRVFRVVEGVRYAAVAASGLRYRPGSVESMRGAWLTPMPIRNRSPESASTTRMLGTWVTPRASSYRRGLDCPPQSRPH